MCQQSSTVSLLNVFILVQTVNNLSELADFVHLLNPFINPFFDYKTQKDAHKALILLLDIFSNICNLTLKENKISTVPEFVDSFFSGIYKISFICQLCQETNIYYEQFHHILLYNQIQIYFHTGLKISMKIKILLVGNALLSLVNLYAHITKKGPIFY